MIINTGSRTDIPAFYSDWFLNRIKEGYVLVRNPYYPKQVYKYQLTPDVVDIIAFTSKNPTPMVSRLDELKQFRLFWHITVTPYGKDIEPNVIDKQEVLHSVIELSKALGKKCVTLRYDPIFITDKYSIAYHLHAFEEIAKKLDGYVESVVISFIDLYEKTKKNFPEVEEVRFSDQIKICREMKKIADKHHMVIRTCLESEALKEVGMDVKGCMTKEILEDAFQLQLNTSSIKPAREGCSCLLQGDIGEYNTCMHLCKYCYANYDKSIVIENHKKHHPDSPMLIGDLKEDDIVIEMKQKSFIDPQLQFDL